MIIDDIYWDIIQISQNIIGKGLSVQENPPIRTGNVITWKDEKDFSKLLRKISYLEKYSLIIENVGLPTTSFTPRASHNACMKVVLPAPMFP